MDRTSFLTGEFRHALDDRGRVAVPVRFRPRLSQGATLARWLDGCLAIFPADAWEELAEKLQALPTTNRGGRAVRALHVLRAPSRWSWTSRGACWCRATCASTPGSSRARSWWSGR